MNPVHEPPLTAAHTALAVAGLVAAGAAAIAAALHFLRRARELEDTPTSKVASAAQGYVELAGRARLMPGPEIRSPLSGQRCVWWSYRIERITEGSRREVEVIEEDTSGELFFLSDTTGDCIVDPDRAHITPSEARRWRGNSEKPLRGPPESWGKWLGSGSYIYHERLIHIGENLYGCGWFRTQAAQQEFDVSRDATELLREWKQDRRDLLRRFDRNGDGQIDEQEWEAVREAALNEVRTMQLERAVDPDLNIFAAPPDGRPYVLSAVPERTLILRFRLLACACAVGAIVPLWVLIQLLRVSGWM